ncbi:origin recognition complex subunit 6 [Anthonomus grandis grandis]|uniref:origin recognition complex subunit 6 n=1 Tax=Anthonomus grandis grandis TaxID=2921223 RepID=UPI00216610FD|nr:origin recognition complex subunit 6 [Anthonomus grandis grandis]
MDRKLLQTTAQRLNVYDEAILKKSEEFIRLYQTKALVKTLDDQAKTVLCLDLAAQLIGSSFDKSVALALCGLKRSAYQNSLNNLEKILGLDKPLTISDGCIQLGCTAIKEDAEDILQKYKQIDHKVKDMDHPQYVAVAIYLACKAKKVSIDKTRLALLSRLKPSQWRELVASFENLGLSKKATRQKNKEINKMEEEYMIETDDQEAKNKQEQEEEEDYEIWKNRILKEAYKELKQRGQTIDSVK